MVTNIKTSKGIVKMCRDLKPKQSVKIEPAPCFYVTISRGYKTLHVEMDMAARYDSHLVLKSVPIKDVETIPHIIEEAYSL